MLHRTEKPLQIQLDLTKQGFSFDDKHNRFICELRRETAKTLRMKLDQPRLRESFFGKIGTPRCSYQGLILWLSLKKGEIKELKRSLEQAKEPDSPITTQKRQQLIKSLNELTGVIQDVNASGNSQVVEEFSPEFLSELEGLKFSLAQDQSEKIPELVESIENTTRALSSFHSKKRASTAISNQTAPLSSKLYCSMKNLTEDTVVDWAVKDVCNW